MNNHLKHILFVSVFKYHFLKTHASMNLASFSLSDNKAPEYNKLVITTSNST